MLTARSIETLGGYAPSAIDAACKPSNQQWQTRHNSLVEFGTGVGLRM